jgi:transposase
MKNNKFIRSTKISLKFLNKEKQEYLNFVIDEYTELLKKYVNYFWLQDLSSLPKFADIQIIYLFDSSLKIILRQCCAKQALGIVKGTFAKQKKRLYILNKLKTEGKIKESKKLQKIIDEVNISCPDIKNCELEIGGDPSLFRIEASSNSFDGWIKFLPRVNEKIFIPFKKTRHFNKLNNLNGVLSKGGRLSKKFITLFFTFDKKDSIQNGKTIGIDIGLKNVISCSNGIQTQQNKHGQDLEYIQRKLLKKKKGSKAFEKTQEHRKNYINWSINQLNLSGISALKRENIKNLRKGIRTNRFMSSWTYANIFNKLDRYCEEQNVSVIKISPTYTSQRCSVCGWVRKSNRKGKIFKCDQCGHTEDSDLNASKNIALDLREIGKKERQLQKNRIGFYWFEEGQENIIPVTQKSFVNLIKNN